jgi:3-oxoacyl-[acyl-carrier-protein] synthase-3
MIISFNVTGPGRCVPERTVTNEDLTALVETSDEWIKQRVGIHSRHICTKETAVDLAVSAAQKALENSGLKACDLELIVAATISNDTVSPSMACMVQNRLGASCMAFDVCAACSGFLFALDVAAGYFARGLRNVLVIGAERMSRLLDWQDCSTCVIFGDGAGAAVLQAGDGYTDSVFTVKGDDTLIRIPQFAGKSPFFTKKTEKPYVYMNGQETFKYAVGAICDDIKLLMDKHRLSIEDLAYIVPHQANKRIIDFACERLKFPKSKFYVNIDRYGNTSSASVPIALDEMNRANLLNKGDRILLTAFGGGLAHAACLMTW